MRKSTPPYTSSRVRFRVMKKRHLMSTLGAKPAQISCRAIPSNLSMSSDDRCESQNRQNWQPRMHIAAKLGKNQSLAQS